MNNIGLGDKIDNVFFMQEYWYTLSYIQRIDIFLNLFKKHKKVYQIHPQVRKWICRYLVWMDDLGVCYIDTQIYDTCEQCPYEVKNEI